MRPESEAATNLWRKKHEKITANNRSSDDVDVCMVHRASQQDQSKGKVVFVSADQANFHETIAGVSMAAISGDADKGAHATFTKFAPGYDAGMHTNTNDVWIVVVKGAYLYKDAAGDKRVGPGIFFAVLRRYPSVVLLLPLWRPEGHRLHKLL